MGWPSTITTIEFLITLFELLGGWIDELSLLGLSQRLAAQEQLNIDETGTKEAGGKVWLWTFVARMFTVFAVRPRREATALRALLGEQVHGIVNCDRAKMIFAERWLDPAAIAARPRSSALQSTGGAIVRG